jgi:PST family polysaccharide transporter
MQAGIRNSLWNGLEKVIVALVSFIAFTIEARNLGPSLFGELSLALSYISFLFPFLDAGQFNLALINLARKEPLNVLVSKVLSSRLLLTPIYLFLLVYLGLNFVNESSIRLIYFTLGIVHLLKVFDVSEIYFLVKSKSRTPASLKAGSQIIGSFIRSISFSSTQWNFKLSSVGHLVAFAPIGIWNIKKVLRSEFKLRFDKIWLINSSFWFLASIISVLYSRLDLFMVNHLLNANETGVFAFSQRISEFFVFVPNLIIASVYPTLVNLPIDSGRFHRFFRTIFIVNILVILSVIISSSLVTLVAGLEYVESITLIRVLIWNLLFTSFAYLRSKWFADNDLHRYGLYTVVVGLLLNTVFNWYLIPLYGATGAAVGTLLSRSLPLIIFLLIPNVKPIIQEYFKAVLFLR